MLLSGENYFTAQQIENRGPQSNPVYALAVGDQCRAVARRVEGEGRLHHEVDIFLSIATVYYAIQMQLIEDDQPWS